jgi:hypothetical protein
MTENYEKDFVPKKPALALKKLGFDESCLMAYLGKEKEPYLKCDIHNMWHLQAKDVLNPLKTPTFSQAFRWFREEHGLSSWIYNSDTNKYFYTILQNGRIVKATESLITYEKAELECLKKLIEIVKQQTHATTN